MAQPIQDDDGKEPGMDNDEGKETESSSLYPLHKFKIMDLSESLYIEIQNKKTKRVYSNSFSKSTLEDMKLNGSITKIIHMIHCAKAGKHDKFQFKFELLFGDPESDKMSINKMSKSYSRGCCMFMIISIDEFFMSGVWPFKLLEKSCVIHLISIFLSYFYFLMLHNICLYIIITEREETDILRDIIEDLQDEIKELKKDIELPRMNPMAVWQSTKATGANVRWDIESMAPTLKGLAKRENNNEDIIIGIHGWYRISIRFGWNSSSGATYLFYLRLNRDKNVAIFRQYYDIGFTMVHVIKLKKGDKLDFYGSSYTNWSPQYNSFMLELLKKEK